MPKLSADEKEIAEAYEAGRLRPARHKEPLMGELKRAASATFTKDQRVNIRLSLPDLSDIQARAAEEGVPYQTLIASVLHKFVTGKLVERPSRLTARSTRTARKRAAG